MNVVIYARYSSHNQTEQSIEGQLNVCKEYAKRNNYNVIGEYIDRAKSGTKDDREQFQKMIKESEKKQFNGILVYQLDRFARDRYDSAVYKRKLKKNNVRVLSARENISEDASGVLMESVLEGMAEYFSLELGQKVKRGMKINADNCYYNGGTVPLGFKLIEVEKACSDNNKPILKKRYAIDEENAYIIKTVFKMYINGSTMADIIRYLNNQNQLTVAKKAFNKNSIRKILLNKKYIGTYSYGGKETHNGIPKIIDDEMFCKAQDIMLKNKKAPARARAKTEYLLTTKLFCGYCKEMMTGISGTSKTKKLHNYYSCKSSRLKLCDKKNVQKDYIENIVVNKARELLTDENIMNIANEVVARVELEKEGSALKRLNKFLKENEKQKINLFDSLKVCDNDNNRKIIFEGMTKLEIEHTQLENEILLEESNFVKITVPQVRYFLLQIRKGNIDDIRYRKILINVLINKIYLYDDKIIGIFNTQDKEFEDRLPSIKDIESSLMGDNALPISDYANIVYFLGGFAVNIKKK